MVYMDVVWRMPDGKLYGVCHMACLYGVCQVNENCDLKICDFGLARMSEIPEKAMLMTCYVVTRW